MKLSAPVRQAMPQIKAVFFAFCCAVQRNVWIQITLNIDRQAILEVSSCKESGSIIISMRDKQFLEEH